MATGENIAAKVEKALKNAGLDGKVGYVIFNLNEFDVVYQNADTILIARLPDGKRSDIYLKGASK